VLQSVSQKVGDDGVIQSVAVIGAGAMGDPIARRIHEGGYKLTVCDKNEDVLTRFAQLGARVTSKAADCASSEVVIVLVATGPQLRDVVLGPGGLQSGLVDGNSPVVAVMGTVSIATILEFQDSVRRSGLRVIDAPISGGVSGAENGTLTVMMGGETADIEFVRPVFSRLAGQLFHCGRVGSAQLMKIINNIVCIANVFISAEAYRLALEHGLNLAETAGVLDVSTGRNFVSADRAGVSSLYATIAHVSTR
jgi:3-hydroxyisobutyrate dehydrogenase